MKGRNQFRLIPSLGLLGLVSCAIGTPPHADVVEREEVRFFIKLKGTQLSEAMAGDPSGNTAIRIEHEIEPVANQHVDLFLEDLQFGDTEIKVIAAFALGYVNTKQQSLIGPLLRGMDDGSPDVRRLAAVSLGRLHPMPPPIDMYKRLLHDPVPGPREGALMGLTFLVREGDDLGMSAEIINALEDHSPFVRNQAVAVAGKIRNPHFVEPLLGLLQKETPRDNDHIRAHIAHVLGAIRDKRANRDLVELLRDYNPAVVEQAWHALMRINRVELERSYAIWREFLIQQEQLANPSGGTAPPSASH